MTKPTEASKAETTSENMARSEVERLSAIFPQFVKDGVVDFDAFREFFGEEGALAEASQERYGLNWKGKGDAFKAIRVPATGTLTPQEEESKNWDSTGNVFIEGDNLEALKLLQRHYRSKIKMIYIDPPYNTGKDFIYKDNFTEDKSDYYERTGQKEGGVALTSNPESNGRYHSDWLTMMYPRLFLARQLLRDDGVIFISIDDNEVANLRLIMDEIFGEENFVGSFIWKKKGTSTNVTGAQLSSLTEYIICYGRSGNGVINSRQISPENREYPFSDSEGIYRKAVIEKKSTGDYDRESMKFEILGQTPRPGKRWQIGKERATDLESKNRFLLEDGIIKLKIYKHEEGISTSAQPNLLLEYGSTQSGQSEVDTLMEGSFFDTPKPVSLIRHLMTIGTSTNDIILDFFAGSGTTAHAVMAQNAEDGGNRKWINVQIPEETNTDSEAYKAGYKTIADISRERIRRAGQHVHEALTLADNPNDLPKREQAFDYGFKSYKLSSSNYRQWQTLGEDTTEEELKEQMKIFIDQPLVDGYSEKDVVYEIALKEGFSLNLYIQDPDATSGKLPLWVAIDAAENGRKLAVTFAKKVTEEDLAKTGVGETDNEIFVCLDSALTDSTKINLARNFNLKVI